MIKVPEPTTVLIKPAAAPAPNSASKVQPGHWVRFGWLSCSYWPFGVAEAGGSSGAAEHCRQLGARRPL